VDPRPQDRASITVLAVVLAGTIGAIGFGALSIDLAPTVSKSGLLLVTALVYAVGAVVVGALAPRRWWLALLAAWGPVILGIAALIAKLANYGEGVHWRDLTMAILVVPGYAMLFGYLGMKVRHSSALGSRRAS
jgi:hypothetical protein